MVVFLSVQWVPCSLYVFVGRSSLLHYWVLFFSQVLVRKLCLEISIIWCGVSALWARVACRVAGVMGLRRVGSTFGVVFGRRVYSSMTVLGVLLTILSEVFS